MGSVFSSTWDPERDMPDAAGKVAVVTGGNTGIGYATVEHLALKGAKVYMASRSETKATEAITKLRAVHPEFKDDQVVWLPLELSDIHSCIAAVETLKKKETKIDILVNNAGISSQAVETSDAGIEMTFAVCHVGHFILTTGILPLLEAAAAEPNSDVRVVTVSSCMHRFIPPSYRPSFPSLLGLIPNNPSDAAWRTGLYPNSLRYSLSKLANVLFAAELQRHFDAENIPIISTSVHPGAVYTNMSYNTMPLLLKPVTVMLFKTPRQGAVTQLFAATAGGVRKDGRFKGAYLVPYGKVGRMSKRARDGKMARELWEETQKAVDGYLGRGKGGGNGDEDRPEGERST